MNLSINTKDPISLQIAIRRINEKLDQIDDALSWCDSANAAKPIEAEDEALRAIQTALVDLLRFV